MAVHELLARAHIDDEHRFGMFALDPVAHPLDRFHQTGTRSVWCHGHLAHAFCLAGNIEKAEEHAGRAMDSAERTGRPLDRVFAMHRRGEVLLEREEPAAAAAQMEEAMAVAERVDAPLFTVWFGCDLTPAYISLGRVEDARQLLFRQEPEARRLALHQFSAHLALRWGELALVDGADDEVARRAAEVLRTARAAKYLVLETAALRLAGAVELARGGSPRSIEAAAQLADDRGLRGEARRARASVGLPYGAIGTI